MVIVNIAGLGLILLIVWWFWLYKPKEVELVDGAINVIVENGTYQPSRIKLTAGESATLQFLRKDSNPCAGTVLFPDIEISEELPIDTVKTIILPALTKGEYEFNCQMKMYRGTLLVE
ncbi:MAG: cupredoxin domain-containing protein [Gammaproteobacteria bacterium]